ncbi:hypothetical protein BDF19DRAFT_423530 [Syncephalis fuscata]|nr:hypothetical protein BDF19DRAFT_423530 [Syncephalis fuscata]
MTSITNILRATAWLLIAASALNSVASLPQTGSSPSAISGSTTTSAGSNGPIKQVDASAALVSSAASESDSAANTSDASSDNGTQTTSNKTVVIAGCGIAVGGVALIVAGLIQHRRVQQRKANADGKPSAEPTDMTTLPNSTGRFNGQPLNLTADTMIDITPPKSPRRAHKTGANPSEQDFDDTASINSTGYEHESTSHLAVQISPRVVRMSGANRADMDGFDDAMVQAPGLPYFNTDGVYGGNAADWAASVNAAGQELADNCGHDTLAGNNTVISPKAIVGRGNFARNNINSRNTPANNLNVDDYLDDDEDDEDDDDMYDSYSDSDTNSVIMNVDQAIEAALPRRRRRSSVMSKGVVNTLTPAPVSSKPPVPPRRVARMGSAPSAFTANTNDHHNQSWRQQQWNAAISMVKLCHIIKAVRVK